MDRFEKLSKILELHSKWTGNKDFFCHRGCASCCSLNVAITSLEAELINNKIGTSLKTKLNDYLSLERFQPKTTTNTIANLAIEDIDPPDEYIPEATEKCPFLDENQCMIYDIRPLSCRVLLSTKNCGHTGAAEMDERIMTINTVFQQYIEILDHDGLSGNMIDLLAHGSNPVFTSKFVENKMPRAIMVPPEFQNEMRELITQINTIISGN